MSVLNALAHIHAHLDGFTQHPLVLDGASDLLAAAFADRAGHVRSVCGVRNLPGRVPVAVAFTVELSRP